jgi:hypothetical protein
MYSIEQLHTLLQEVLSSQRQFAVGSGGGAPGERANFVLDQPIGGQTAVSAICLTNCSPGAGRTTLVLADDGQWYAFEQEPARQQASAVVQNRRRRGHNTEGKVAAVVAISTQSDEDDLSGKWRIYLAGHTENPVFLCEVPMLIPGCPRPIPVSPPPEEIITVDTYFWGGPGINLINWQYHPAWYCPQREGALLRTESLGGGRRASQADILAGRTPIFDFCGSMSLYIPPLEPPMELGFDRIPFPVFSEPSNGLRLFYNQSVFVDAAGNQTHPRCEFYTEEELNYFRGQGWNMEPVAGFFAWGLLDINNPSSVIYTLKKKATFRRDSGPGPELVSFYMNRCNPDRPFLGTNNCSILVTLTPIGHQSDNICTGGNDGFSFDPPPPPPIRTNDVLIFLSGDQSSWYVSVLHTQGCFEVGSLDAVDLDFYKQYYTSRTYFRVNGDSVEVSIQPFEEDWRWQRDDDICKKYHHRTDGNYVNGEFFQAKSSAHGDAAVYDFYRTDFREVSGSGKPNIWFDPQRELSIFKSQLPETTCVIPERKDSTEIKGVKIYPIAPFPESDPPFSFNWLSICYVP